MSTHAPMTVDLPVCCDCRKTLLPVDPKVSVGTADLKRPLWRCADCEYEIQRSAA